MNVEINTQAPTPPVAVVSDEDWDWPEIIYEDILDAEVIE